MILVDVVFPELDRIIDFQIDESVRGWDILEEITGMAAQSCGKSFSVTEQCVVMYSVDRECQIDLSKSLKSNGIRSGDRLLLI